MDTVEKINYRGHIATLVDKIPSGFVVWNTMINGEYVPFCKQGSCKRAYDLSDLRVIKMEKGEVKIIKMRLISPCLKAGVLRRILIRLYMSQHLRMHKLLQKKPRRVLIKSFLQSSIKNILSLLIITVQSNHIIISKIKIQKTEYITKFCLIFRLLLKK